MSSSIWCMSRSVMSTTQYNTPAHTESSEHLEVGSGDCNGRFARGFVVAYLICLPMWLLIIYAAHSL